MIKLACPSLTAQWSLGSALSPEGCSAEGVLKPRWRWKEAMDGFADRGGEGRPTTCGPMIGVWTE